MELFSEVELAFNGIFCHEITVKIVQMQMIAMCHFFPFAMEDRKEIPEFGFIDQNKI